jgi:hypothetical protein
VQSRRHIAPAAIRRISIRFDLNFAPDASTNARIMKTHTLVLLLAALTLFGSGCRKDEVTSYRIPKEVSTSPNDPHGASAAPGSGMAAPAGGAAGDMANTAVATATGAALSWTAPAHWTAKTGSSMRKGSYAVKGDGAEADMAITAFPGDVGGDLANLNRWRGQISLPPVGQAEFEAATQHLDRNGLHMTVADIVGTGDKAQRILGAMVPYAGATWFFKLSGPDALVAKEKVAFMAFLDTVKPAAPAK